jgi:FtsZ-binding cell division protein ZapB
VSDETAALQARIAVLEAELGEEREKNQKWKEACERVLESKDAVEAEREKLRRAVERWFDEAFDHLRALVEIEKVIGKAQVQGSDVQKAFQRCLDVTSKRKASPEFRTFIESAIRVARLNMDREDSIRPQTNGAVDAYHRLETALLMADLAEVEETEYTQRVRMTVFKKRDEG